MESLTRELAALRADASRRDQQIAMLREQLSSADLDPTKLPAASHPASGSNTEPGSPESDSAASTAAGEEFDTLLTKVLGEASGTPTADETQRFWELARTTDFLAGFVGELDAFVKENPDDTEARLDLARGYVAKLLTVPSGPERAGWAAKAEGEWRQVLEANPASWEAQFSMATSWSHYPDLLNKTTDAIGGFVKAREIQEAGAAEPHQSRTYLRLSRLYLRQADSAKARTVLKAGLERHADDTELKSALDALTESKDE